MPFGEEGVESGIGLALSGGGYRATLFHLGSLWRLNDLGYLPRLDRVSSVSGGSITAGHLAVQWAQLAFSKDVAANFVATVVGPLRKFCEQTIDTPSVWKGLLTPWKSVSDFVEKAYRKKLLGNATLQSLPDRPRFVFNATNFKTGVTFRYSRPYAGDYRIGLIMNPPFTVARAVTASSAFPPVLSPVTRKLDPSRFTKTKGADLYDQVDHRKTLVLTDGGVYDNLGLETLWNRYKTLLVSDAGAPFDPERRFGSFWPKQAFRVMDITTNQARALRKRALISDYKSGVRHGTYWGIGSEIRDYGVSDSLPVPESKSRELASTRTRLNHFTEREQCELINWGYAICDAAMRRYVISGPAPPPRWPYPNYALG